MKSDLKGLALREQSREHVDHPEHYLKDSGHEVIDVIEAWRLSFSLGNAVKYIARAGKKSPETREEDLKKAIWYIQRELEKGAL